MDEILGDMKYIQNNTARPLASIQFCCKRDHCKNIQLKNN